MDVELETIAHHSHDDATGTAILHTPGDRYILRDVGLIGLTAAQLAARFVALGVAKRIDTKPKVKAAK